jgi:ABC-2 type transport system ATP-binding protein
VVLAHGFGGSKQDGDADARYLAQHGYVALAYSARGFGRSGGLIHLDASGFEVADASKLVDLLAARPEVLQDAPGDPRVGFTGPSYGGALTLLAAGHDPRIDAIAPQITWNDLGRSLFGQSAQDDAGNAPRTPAGSMPITAPGVFKKAWAGLFFGAGATQEGSAPTSLACGRFAPDVCRQYQATAASGTPTPELLDLLAASSPARVAGRIKAPSLLVQGEADSLFPLGEADANARAIAAGGTPVKTVWYSGGHDSPGGSADQDRLRSLTLSWFDRYLKHDGSKPDTSFQFAESDTGISLQDGSVKGSTLTTPGYPGLAGTPAAGTTSVTLSGAPQDIVAPAGGFPAAITSLPGLGSALGQLNTTGLVGSLGGASNQDATFSSASLPAAVLVVGSPTVTVHVISATGDATLFAKLYDAAPDQSQVVLPEQLVAPVRLSGLPPGGADVRIKLPAVVHRFAAGHQLRLVVSTTDQAYQLPLTPQAYHIALADGTVSVPTVAASTVTDNTLLVWTAGVGAATLLFGAAGWYVLRRRRDSRETNVDPDLVDVPVVITGLGKAYGDGFRAVADLSFRIEQGQVLGLLGPNGAGKTTTLRMLVGLIRPSEGSIHVFGHRISAGAPVLSRVGAFIEGPGFLPHLSGLENLTLSWAVTGRPETDADIDAALELAGLGADVHRKVRTYSQGMRQRLAVAQAMLGLPDLLVLDEPTNGLDPPQIREMREALRRYAATGRTVVVSSHLLAEVEQTCTYCLVMHRGRLLAAGPVEELIGAASSVSVEVDDVEEAVKVLTPLAGIRGIDTPEAGGLVLDLDGIRPGVAVGALVAAGVAVDRVAPRHQLEDVFLSLVNEGEPQR